MLKTMQWRVLEGGGRREEGRGRREEGGGREEGRIIFSEVGYVYNGINNLPLSTLQIQYVDYGN
jgi:hypothetical protein